MNETTPNIAHTLLAIQTELKAPKSQYNSFGKYNYRNCEDILEAAKPLCNKYGAVLHLSDDLLLIGERYYVKATATLRLVSDPDSFLQATAYAREEAEKKGMDGSQVTGAASSYARKYALNGLLDIDDTKDSDTTNTKDSDTTNTGDSKPAALPFKCECCGKEIAPYKDKTGRAITASKHANASKAKFGKVLCLECIAQEQRTQELKMGRNCRFKEEEENA